MFRGEFMEIDTSLIEEAQEKEKLEKLEEEFGYARFREDFGKIPRGTVLTKARTVWGFPHIHRIFTLEAGVARNIKDDEVYVLEVNPRASRTVPFVSKTTGVSLAKLAAKVMTGETLKKLGLTKQKEVKHI